MGETLGFSPIHLTKKKLDQKCCTLGRALSGRAFREQQTASR